MKRVKPCLAMFLVIVLLFGLFSACNGTKIPNENHEKGASGQTTQTEHQPITKLSTHTLNVLTAYYDDVLYFERGNEKGIMNNEGNILYTSSYRQLKPLPAPYIAGIKEGGGYWEVSTYSGEVIIPASEKCISVSSAGAGYLLLGKESGALYPQCVIYDLAKRKVLDGIDLSLFSCIYSIEFHGGGLQLAGDSIENGQILFCICSLERQEAIYLDGGFVMGGYGVAKDGKLYDAAGNYLMDTNVQQCYPHRVTGVGMAAHYTESEQIVVYQDDALTVINHDGNALFAGDYKLVDIRNAMPAQNLFLFKKGGYYGVIRMDGTEVIPFMYDEIEYCNDYFVAELDDILTVFDGEGNKIGDIAEELSGTADMFAYKQKGQYCILNPQTAQLTKYEKVSAIKYRSASSTTYYSSSYDYVYTGYYIVANSEGKYAIADGEKLLTESVYDNITCSMDGRILIAKNGNTYTVFQLSIAE